MADTKLIELAHKASARAYVPYSQFPIGAVLVTSDDTVITGCNVENASFGLTNCGERTAFFKAVSEGYQSFKALYIYGTSEEPISPCGACRQVMVEFCDEDMPVVLINKDLTKIKETTVGELLPYNFTDLD
jgi:cytidine deaminase